MRRGKIWTVAGDKLIIEPAPPTSLLSLLAELEPLEKTFPPIEDAPPRPVSL